MPLRFGALGLSDTQSVSWNQIGTGDHARRETLDEWGCPWVRSEVANMGQVKGHPLADGLNRRASLDRYRWPDPDDPAFYTGMAARFAGGDGKYVATGIFMLLFERMHALHGFEASLRDLYLERTRIERLADRIVEFDLGIIANIGRRFPGQIHRLGHGAGRLHQPEAVRRVLQAALPAALRRAAQPGVARLDAFVRQGGRVH